MLSSADEKSGILTVLSSPVIEAVYLLKQPSKRRFINSAQKRYFVVTANEVAYKEKSEDTEYKTVWKIPADVISVEMPAANSKEFAITVMEGDAQRVVRLIAPDIEEANKFTTAVQNVLKKAAALAAAKKSVPNVVAAMDNLAIQNAPPAVVAVSQSVEASKVTTDIVNEASSEPTLEAAQESSTAAVEVATTEEEPVLLSTSDDIAASKPNVWFWSMCCSAE